MTNQPTLTIEQAKMILVPFYKLLNKPNADTIKAQIEAILPSDWKSYSDETNWKGRDGFVGTMGYIAKTLPDLVWEVKEMLISGNRVIVRSQLSATPKGNFLGQPTDSKAFSVMAIDIHTLENGKPTTAYHIEDWHNAITQLKAQ